MEIPDGFHLEIAAVEPGAKGDLDAKRIRRGLLLRKQFAACLILPFRNASAFGEPLAVGRWSVRLESRNGGDEPNAILGLRVAAEKIMLRQAADKPVPAEQQRDRFDDRTFARAVRAHQHGLPLAEFDSGFPDSAEVFDIQLPNPHAISVLLFVQQSYSVAPALLTQ